MDGTWPVITIAPVENDEEDDYTSRPDSKNPDIFGLTPESNLIPVVSICEPLPLITENLEDDGSPTFEPFTDASSGAKDSISPHVLDGLENGNDSYSISASSICEMQPLVKTENVDENESNSVASSSMCETQPLMKIENVEDTSSFDFKFCTAVSEEATDGDNDVFGQDYSKEHDRSSSTSDGSSEDSDFMIEEPKIKKMRYNKSKTYKWKCFICGELFPYKHNLTAHRMISHDLDGTSSQGDRIKDAAQQGIQIRIYKCIDCYKEFLNFKDYQHHIHNHTDYDTVNEQLRHGCEICGKTISDEDALFDHLETAHNKTTERRCSMCPKTFRRRKEFNVHVSNHLLPDIKLHRLRACEVCLKICNSSSELREHNMQMHAQKFFICRVCDTNFEDKEALKKHIQQFGDTKENHIKIPRCQFCGLYHENSYRTSHFPKLAAGKLYVCPICDGILPDMFTMKDLEAHIKDHGLDSALMCWQCRVICDSAEQLRSHKKTHKYKMYRCEICSDVFQLLSSYMKHVRRHKSLLTPFQCHIKECGAYFPTRSLLVKHCELHYKYEDPAYNCGECGLRMNSSDSYRSHMYNHLGIKTYNCKLCKMVFIEKRSYDQHQCSSKQKYLDHKLVCKAGKQNCGKMCKLCKLNFSSTSSYNIHLRTCGKQKQRNYNRFEFQRRKILCSICGLKFTPNMLTMHQYQCHGIGDISQKPKTKVSAECSHKSIQRDFSSEEKLENSYHKCLNCQETFVSTQEYVEHRRACKFSTWCKCCKRFFRSFTELKIHLQTCGKQKETKSSLCRKWCTICGLKLESFTLFTNHYKQVHNMDRDALTEHLKPDAYKRGSTWGEYKKTEILGETQKCGSIHCEWCKLHFASSTSYSNHLKTCRKTMDPGTESTWCTVCGQTLESAALLEMHRRIVHKECAEQNKVAGKHIDSWLVKQKNHQGPKLNEAAFLCPVEKCSMAFDNEMEMKEHLVTSHQAVAVESSNDEAKSEQAETLKLHEIDFEAQEIDNDISMCIAINSAVSKPRIQNAWAGKVPRGVKGKWRRNKTKIQLPMQKWKTCGKCGKSYKFVHGCELGNY